MNPYIPCKLPLEQIDYKRIIGLVGESNAEIARYDGLLQGIVSPIILLSPLTTQEAVLSSKIEGTQATLDEVLEHEAGIVKDEEKVKDIQEISNYRKALINAAEEVSERPLSLYLIRQMHRILLDSVRGREKTPGEFRKDQNWIANPGTPIEQAIYVPPNPMVMNDCLQEWEDYIAYNEFDILVQLAIIHAQFEIIHPFKDGNGRIGRLLIPLFLFQKKILSHPMFYLSSYLEENREIYYEKLRKVSIDSDWDGWIEFFLNAIKHQAKVNSEKVKNIMELYDNMKIEVQKITHSQYTLQIVDTIFEKPIFSSSDFIRLSGIPKPSASKFLNLLKDNKLLIPISRSSGRKPAVYAFRNLINEAEGKKIL